MTAALALAEVVVARGHVGTEADTLARALIAEVRQADVLALRLLLEEADHQRTRAVNDPMIWDAEFRALLDALDSTVLGLRARLEVLGEKP